MGSLKTTPFPIKSKIEVVHSNEEGIFYVKFFWRKMVASTQILKKNENLDIKQVRFYRPIGLPTNISKRWERSQF